ncbi:MAG: hypothetical protein AAGI12_00490 [Pseudomonadota bacterium]
MASQYRYSQSSFQVSVVTALGLTAIVCFLVWLFSRLAGVQNVFLVTSMAGIVFFSFCSAAMVWRYLRREIVVAARPDGLFDARFSTQAVPWDAIKDLRLQRAENEFRLAVYLWPDAAVRAGAAQKTNRGEPGFVIDLEPLDAGVETVLQSIATYKSIAMEQG